LENLTSRHLNERLKVIIIKETHVKENAYTAGQHLRGVTKVFRQMVFSSPGFMASDHTRTNTM